MSTRLKRPPIWRHFLVTGILIAFQAYLGYSVMSGQFGIDSRDVLEGQIDDLGATSSALQAEIDSFRHRIDLFQTTKMDPDLVSERARALLSMSNPSDVVVMVDQYTGKPLSGSSALSTNTQLSGEIERGID
jgi:cell division protein FtsB